MTRENFVTCDWLAARLGEPELGIVDGSWHLPPTGRVGSEEFRLGHIPGAVFFDIDAIADTSTGLPHMLPDETKFADEMTTLGLGDGMRFVVYDSPGLFAAARVWWTLRAFGAEVVVVPTAVPPDHPEYYIQKAKAIVAATPGAILADQHFNPVNPDAHYRTTGPEIWEQTEGRITHFVCSPGTGGTVTGVGRFLKEKNPAIRVIAPDPIGSIYTEYARSHTKGEGFPYKVEGIGGDKIPTSLDFRVVDEFVQVGDKEAFRMARRLTREEGLFVGGSTGMNVHVALDVARRLDDPAALVVTILCDTGERYVSKVYDDEWMRANQMLDTVPVTVEALIAQHPAGIPPLVSVAPAASVRQALNLMSTYGISQVPVIAGNDCVGSVTEGPVISRALEDAKLLERAVSDVMQPPFPVVEAALPIERLNTLLSHETQAALVRKDGRLVGIVTRYDVLRQVAGIR